MDLTFERNQHTKKLCNEFRIKLIDVLYYIQTGHPGGSLSSVEIITTLYFNKMNIDPCNKDMKNRDRFILSKGHAAPILYLVLAELGYFPKEDIFTLRQLNSYLQGHPCANKTPGVDFSTGSLGLGLSAGLGMALVAKMDGRDYYTYVLLGDGEIQEGIIWEAAMAAVKFKADNLIAILDNNGVQLDGTTDEIMPLGNISDKWKAFGWNVIQINGHSVSMISNAINEAKKIKGVPTMIIASTIKGKGVSFMEGKSIWHGKSISKQEYKQAMNELRGDTDV